MNYILYTILKYSIPQLIYIPFQTGMYMYRGYKYLYPTEPLKIIYLSKETPLLTNQARSAKEQKNKNKITDMLEEDTLKEDVINEDFVIITKLDTK